MSGGLDRTLAELVVERPSAARVFERLGLDYCCGGRRSLVEACRARGLDAATVAALLESDLDLAPAEAVDWRSAPIGDLCAHIVEEHHGRLRRELPRLGELAERAASVHGDKDPRLRELQVEFERLRAELEGHVEEEERELFPSLVAGAALDSALLKRLVGEHDATGLRLQRLRGLGDGYATEGAFCGTHRALLEGLHELEVDLHQHVHEENNILFPRARAAGAEDQAAA